MALTLFNFNNNLMQILVLYFLEVGIPIGSRWSKPQEVRDIRFLQLHFALIKATMSVKTNAFYRINDDSSRGKGELTLILTTAIC